MRVGRAGVLAVCAASLLSACSPAVGGGDATAAKDRRLEADQRALSEQALAGLAARSCPQLPDRTVLQGLPDDVLGCLGTGPARAVNAGDGRPTLVNLWASWCAPCVEEMPLLQDTAVRAGEAVRFVGIDTQDRRDSAAGLLDATGVGYEQLEDTDGIVRKSLRAVGLPVTLVFDAQGREVARRFGEVDAAWLEDALRSAGAPLAPLSAAPAAVPQG